MKRLYLILGLLFVILGFIGIFIPVWPTTPFILLAMVMFAKTDRRFDEYILKNKIIGPPLKNYLENRSMTCSFKIKTLLFLWVGLAIAMFFQELIWIVWLLVFIGISVSVHILLLKNE